ncbi:hypothetical protein [Aliivibrio fischeri]|uniref:hypothetical protein n=1 Tax=Aliivibrio fischeri TaxID=668 RepID=UPI00084C842B|nr:hypothetical protein [Aliivibrio fischeri]OED55541.1 hypothetical protein BEI46_11760 [Aliivibrio fischeri]
MTTLVCWVGVDSHGPTSVYIASDSRISWGDNRWNLGRKLYASKNSANILGFSGKISLPSQVLGQIMELIDNGIMFSETDTFEVKLEKIRRFVDYSYKSLPANVSGKFTIVYASRSNIKMNSTFHVATIKGSAYKIVKAEVLNLPSSSDVIHRSGSGYSVFKKNYEKWVGDPREKKIRTSRAVFSSLCESISSGKDPFTGGAPQLVGLYRSEGNGQSFGVIHEQKRFLYGALVEDGHNFNQVEWRNELFEICCGEQMSIKGKAQRQPKII